MEVMGLVDKRNIYMLLGCYCNNPRLVLDKRYETKKEDYNESFHRVIWGAINNIARRSNIDKITATEINNELSTNQQAYELWRVNEGSLYITKAMEETQDKIFNIEHYYDTVRKYALIRSAYFDLKLDISFIYNESDLEIMEQFTKMSHKEVLSKLNERFISFKKEWGASSQDAYDFHAGEDIDDLIAKFKRKDSAYGYPHQSQYLTTIFRGMRPKKFMLRSCPSGVGKTRLSLAEACNIATDYIYDWKQESWVSTGAKQNVLFITTELEREEIQSCLLSHISGIGEDRLSEWDVTSEEEEIILQAKERMKDSTLFCEFISDFTIADIEQLIERYVIKYDVRFVFFDYINETPSLMADYVNKSGVSLKTHQVLFLFSNSLKLLANKYNIYLSSSTQLSSNWKEENQRDANALKGSKAIAEKVDYGVLGLPVTQSDLKKLRPILMNGFYDEPNMAYYIYKNRGNKYKACVVWTKLDLGTVREQDCFVTDLGFEIIHDIEKTVIELFNDIEVDEVSTLDAGTEGIGDFVNSFNDTELEDLKELEQYADC